MPRKKIRTTHLSLCLSTDDAFSCCERGNVWDVLIKSEGRVFLEQQSGKTVPNPVIIMDFKNNKKQILQASDLSKKGSIDESIRDLVNYINEQEDYVTTSSCSGRTILYTSVFGCMEGHKKSKKDCKWLYTSHDCIDPESFIPYVDPMEGDLIFKFEPFILHIQCSSIEKAKFLHTIALGAGFRDSGMTIGKHGKITLAIRSNLRLEVPLSQDSVMLVSDMFLKFLAEQANEKMEANQRSIKHFFIILKENLNGKKSNSSNENSAKFDKT